MNHSGNKNAIIIVFSFMLIIIASCNLINPAEPVPSYVKINNINFTSSPVLGSSSNNITDVYVNIDNAFQGAYPLPANFPLLETGDHQMIFFPGIIMNGISNTRTAYPFYKPFTASVHLESGKITEINPTIAYYDSVVCTWCENFDGAGFSLTKASTSDTDMVQLLNNDPNIFEGIGCGAVYLDDARIQFKVTTSGAYMLPVYGSSVYLELNYKCNQAFMIGIIANSTNIYTVPVITVNAKETWNKLYIELGSVIQAYADASDFEIYISASKLAEVTNPEFYFDNFKLLHD